MGCDVVGLCVVVGVGGVEGGWIGRPIEWQYSVRGVYCSTLALAAAKAHDGPRGDEG